MKNSILKWGILTGLWAVLIIPFLVANTMFFPYISGKNFVFRIIVEIIFALWVYLAYVNPKYRPKWSVLSITLTAFVSVMAFATFFAEDPSKAFWSNFERMDGYITTLHLFAYFLVFGSVMKTEKIWLAFFRTSLATTLFVIIGVFQEDPTTRADTTFGNPIYLAVYLLFNFFFALILLYKDVIVAKGHSLAHALRSWLTYAYLVLAGLTFFGIWRSQTRGVILGLLGGLVVTAIVMAVWERTHKGLRKLAIGTLCAITLLVGGFIMTRNSDFVQNNTMLARLAQISWSSVSGSGQARQWVWPMAIEGFKERPILGWGQEGFNYVFSAHYDPRMYAQEQWFDRAHNTLLDVLVAGGALGFLSYIALFGAALFLIWKKRRVLGVTDSALLAGLLAAYVVQGLFVFDNLISYIYFFIILAYIHSRSVETDDVSGHGNPGNEDKANYILAPIIILSLGASIWYLNVVPMVMNANLISALRTAGTEPAQSLEYFKRILTSRVPLGKSEAREQLTSIAPRIGQSQADVAVKQGFADLAYTEIQQQLKETPNSARYYLFAGTFLNNMNQYALAKPYLLKAVELSPAKQTMMFELIKTYGYLGEFNNAFALAKHAYELEPNYVDAEWAYAAGAVMTNNRAIANAIFAKYGVTNNLMIVQAYVSRASQALKNGARDTAIAEIREAIRLNPGFASQGNVIIEGIQKGTIN